MMIALYEHIDKDGDKLSVEHSEFHNFITIDGLYGRRCSAYFTEDQTPDLAQAILKAASMQAWIVEKRDPETLTYWFPVVDGQIVCELGRITPSKARELAAEFLRAADVADEQKVKAKAKESLDELYKERREILRRIEEAEMAADFERLDAQEEDQ